MNVFKHLGIAVAICAASVCAAQTSPAAGTGDSYRIFGVVVDLLSNQPIAGARVMISPIAERNSVRTVKTSSNGSFLFDRLPRGKYSLGAESRGYPTQGYDQHEAYATAIAVGPGLDSEHVIFRLRPACAIRGTVTSDENEPVEGATVRLFTSTITNGRSAIRVVQINNTDDRGYYSFPHLRGGDYYVAVSGQPWYAVDTTMFRQIEEQRAQTLAESADPEALARLERESLSLNLVYPLTFYSGTQSPEEAIPIHVAPGESATADILLHAVRPARIHVPAATQAEPTSGEASADGRGTITFSTGSRSRYSPPPQIRVTQMVFGEPVDIFHGLSSTANSGELELTGIAPGHYSLTITQPGKDESTSTTQEVDLVGDMDLPTTGGISSAKVTGIVISDASPPEQSVVRLFARDHHRIYGATISEGKFRIEQPVLPGIYEVGIGSTSDERYIKSLSATGAKIKGRSIQIVAGQPVQISIVLGRGMSRIDGVATRGDKPVAGAMILLVPSDFENDSLLLRRDQSDSDGTFTLGSVVPGKYRVIAIQNGWQISWADPKTIQPYLKNIREVDVSGEATMNVKVEVQPLK